MTHALLLTDVVDSTKLSEQLGAEANGVLWAEHDRVARALLADHGGFELERTDGIGGLFPSVDAALAFAAAYHAATAALTPPLVVRAALHAGDLTVRENPPEHVARGAKRLEVDGLGVAIAARVLSVCGGGSTLLTADRPGARSRGHWRLKGVSEPVELFEVGDGAPPADAAKAWRVVAQDGAWIPARHVPHRLPTERDPFVGRRADLERLADLLDAGAHLVSVLGIGGTGKTRLVTHYGWTSLGDWPGGVWFCDLSEARSVDGIVYAVARALDVSLGQGDPVVQLGHAIAGRGRCLVVLDNFEQVTRHAEETLGRWLDRAHEAAFVVTTREILGLPGEQALALAPLPAADGAALFVARARSAKRDFEPDDVASIDALVKLLDGLPLAIELAAARVRVMPPKTLLARMSERFKLLSSSGGRHTRQATLRGALDWSWDLLSADEQTALAQLSVFEGGFTLEAAEGVLALSALWPMDAVQALVDKSLVRQLSAARSDAVRMDLLVSVQEYASERLDASGTRAEAETRHGQHYAAYGADEPVDAFERGDLEGPRALSPELDNLVSASRRAAARADGDVARATLRAAWAVLSVRGPYVVAVQLAADVLGVPTLAPRTRGLAAWVLARALTALGRYDEAWQHMNAALALARTSDDRRLEGRVLASLGGLYTDLGRSAEETEATLAAALAIARQKGAGGGVDRKVEALVHHNRGTMLIRLGRMEEGIAQTNAALAVYREVGERRSEALVLTNLASVALAEGRMDQARAYLDAAFALARHLEDRATEAVLLTCVAMLHAAQGRMGEARATLEAALTLTRAIGSRRWEGNALCFLGNVHLVQGRREEARATLDAALPIVREVGDRRNEGVALGFLGTLHQVEGRVDEAQAHFHAALAVLRGVANPRREGVVRGALGVLHLEQGRADEARAQLATGEALLRSVREPAELGKLLCGRARLELHEGRPDAARATLAEVEAIATGLGAGPESELGLALAQARTALDSP